MTDAYATSAGAYVLGALSPNDRAAFEGHLDGCAACRAAVEDVAGVPGLLARVPLTTVLGFDGDGSVAGPVPTAVLPMLLHAARRERGRRRWITAGVGAAAAAAVAAAVLVAVRPSGAPQPPAPAPSASSTAQPSTETDTVQALVPVAPTRLVATVSLRAVGWGTQVDLRCGFLRPDPAAPTGSAGDPSSSENSANGGESYTLLVVDRHGMRQTIGTWTALPGRDVTLAGATSLSRRSISAVEILEGTQDGGSPVLRLDEAS